IRSQHPSAYIIHRQRLFQSADGNPSAGAIIKAVGKCSLSSVIEHISAMNPERHIVLFSFRKLERNRIARCTVYMYPGPAREIHAHIYAISAIIPFLDMDRTDLVKNPVGFYHL